MKEITINGKTYKAVEITFNTVCELEGMGITMDEMSTKAMSFVRAYLSLCMNRPAAFAGAEMNEHIINGGTLDDVVTVIAEMIEESGFFHALSKRAEKKTGKSKAKKEEKAEPEE